MAISEHTTGNTQTDKPESQQSTVNFRFNPLRQLSQWFRNLKVIEKFNLWIVAFTAVLTITALLQFFSYIESERGYLVLDDVFLQTPDPIVKNNDLVFNLIVRVKNVGRHTATVTLFNTNILIGIVKKDLPTDPTYPEPHNIKSVIYPIPPGNTQVVPIFNSKSNLPIAVATLVDQIKQGTVPLYIYGKFEYTTGYFFRPGETAFCLTYIPEFLRWSEQKLQPCDNPNYIYSQ